MHSNFFNELKALLEKLPGIGPRQASRFIWTMLDFAPEERKKLSELIGALDKHLVRCVVCFRAAPSDLASVATSAKEAASAKEGFICSFCRPNPSRDQSKIMILERDSDLFNIEKSGIYKGLYHILGGALDPLEGDSIVRERIKKLYERTSNQLPAASPWQAGSRKLGVGSYEIILALSPTKLGEFTASYIEKILEPLVKSKNLPDGKAGIKISRLARGLSTGTDLEYADEITLKQALDNRK